MTKTDNNDYVRDLPYSYDTVTKGWGCPPKIWDLRLRCIRFKLKWLNRLWLWGGGGSRFVTDAHDFVSR